MDSSYEITVGAAVVHHRGRVLIARRMVGESLAGKWEFPGGKFEDGESIEQCLVREFDEEFGMQIKVGLFLERTTFPYKGGRGELIAHQAEALTLPVVLTAHDAALWVRPESLTNFNLSPADHPIANKLHFVLKGA